MIRSKKINKRDLQELRELCDTAAASPVMLMGGVDISQRAWGRVTDRLQWLANKYRQEPGSGINLDTGEWLPPR